MINKLNTTISLDNQLKWELCFKYEIRRYYNIDTTISYCKQPTKKDVARRKYHENKVKILENVLDNDIKDGIEEI